MEEAYRLLIAGLAFPFIFSLAWVIRHKKRGIVTLWNLRFRRARSVKVNFRTASNRVIEHVVVPDERGFMAIDGGYYKFDKEFATTNSKLSIPEIDILEAQIVPSDAGIVEVKDGRKITIKVKGIDGKLMEEERLLPLYVVQHQRLMSRKLEGLMAKEVHDVMNSKIVRDITTATSQTMSRLDLMFFMIIGILGVCLLGFIVIFNQISALRAVLEAILLARAQP